MEVGVTVAQSKCLKRHMQLKKVGVIVMIFGLSPYFTSRYLTKILSHSKNTALNRLKELGYKKKWKKWMPYNRPTSQERKRERLLNARLVVSTAVYWSMNL